MTTINSATVGGTAYDIEDTTARASAASAAQEAEWDRQLVMGTYGGRSVVDVLGASGFDDAVAKLHSLAQSQSAGALRPMDYIDVTPTSTDVNGGSAIRYRFSDAGLYHHYGDTDNPYALLFVPDSPVSVGGSYGNSNSCIPWNTDNTNNGTADQASPYLASNLHKWETEVFLPALPTSLQNVLADFRVLLETRYSADGTLTDSTGWAWGNVGKVFSPSETEVYGQCVWGTKGHSVGIDEQWSIFRQLRRKGMRNLRWSWWLRSVSSGSSSWVCRVYGYGDADYGDATYAWVHPLPCFRVA